MTKIYLDNCVLSCPFDDQSELQKLGFVGFDAVHLACAEAGKADIFLTTDDRLLKLARRLAKKLRVKVENPLDWMKASI